MADKSTESARPMTFNLYNRFAELMLVVGLDENTGLTPFHRDAAASLEEEDEEEEESLNSLFFRQYEAQVLAAISSSKALVFQPYLMEDPSYPPRPDFANGDTTNFHHLRRSRMAGTSGSRRQVQAVNAAVIKQHLNKGDSSKSVADLPLSKDAIESITTFCFPDNAHIYRQKPDSNIHFLVLTDVSGSKTYASCLTFYKPYRLSKDSRGTIHFELLTDPGWKRATDGSVDCFIPQCCVLVSKYPYFYAMKECLSCMISHVERDLEEMYQFIKDFTYTMTMAPVPPAGSVIVEMSVYNLSVSLFPSESPEKPVIDLPLHLAFLCFPVDDLLSIFTAILCEERLVFVSFNYALLTTIMESFLYYILPMTWRFTYVPILSASSLELLEAPGTFMMGCNSKHLDVVEQVEGLVVVNIDEGTVTINPTTNGGLGSYYPHNMSMSVSAFTSSMSSGVHERSEFTMVDRSQETIPNLPEEPAKLFKNICKRAKFQMELSDVQRPFYYDIEEERAFRMKKCLQFNTEISFAFLEMMVNLFRGTLSYLKIDLRRFNKQQFLESIAASNRPFYEKVLNTDMFKQFLEDRLSEKVDYWTDHEIRTRPYAKRVSQDMDISPGLSHRQQMKPMRKQVSVTTFSSLAPRTFEILRLPALNDTATYVKHSLNMLNKTIEECRNPYFRPSYIYMRGMFLAAEGNIKAALDDLLSLHGHNVRLLPIGLIKKLLQLLAESEREEMLRVSGRHVAELLVPAEHDLEKSHHRHYRSIMDNRVAMPDADLSLEEFVETVSLLEMSTDYDTIQRLFLALAQPQRPTHVEKYTFEVLRLSYEDNQTQCESLALPKDCLQNNEIILRVSNLIKTDFGMGRIVLTDKRLFFIKDVSNRYKEIVKLRNITSLERIQTHWYLIAVDVLVINDTMNKVKFTAWLKEERNNWAILIEEMRAGKIVSEATRDFTAIGQAVQNVLLVDAVIRSGQDERTTHHKHVTRAAETLCYFSGYISEGRHNLPPDTLQALQHRVDPNMGQRERKTVEVLLYTAGGQGSESTNCPPRLWCGMGDGKVRVFDATNWALEESFVLTKATVSALVAVGQGQVWAGSHGIFIIDVDTISCNKTLTEHADLVADICLTNSGRHVYSASVDGLIVMWEVQTLRVMRKICLTGRRSLRRIMVHGDRIWCGTWQSIIVLDYEGIQLQTFSYTDPDINKQLDLDCFHIFNNEIWAGCRRQGQLIVWDLNTTKLKQVLRLDCRGISEILLFGDKVWVGTKDGTIYIYHTERKVLWKTIRAHEDAIRSLCSAESRYIMSGAGSKDGKVAIWSPNVEAGDVDIVTAL